MSSEDKEAQEDELLALASIYDEEEFKRAESAQGGETRICLELPQNFKVFVSGELSRFVLPRNEVFPGWFSAQTVVPAAACGNTAQRTP